MLVALAVVVLCYCGGKYCPKVLSSNKELVLGVLVGMALCSFAGLKMEGFESAEECKQECQGMDETCETYWQGNNDCNGVLDASTAFPAKQDDPPRRPLKRLPTLPKSSGSGR